MWKSHSLIRTAEFIACCIVMQCALFGQTVSPEDRARADQALEMARAGNTEGSLKLYETVLKSIPNDVPVLRDYAVVLGWAGKYPEAIKAIKKLRDLQNEQPIWA